MILLAETAIVRRGLVVDDKATHFRRIRQAIWLYVYLLLAANPRTGKRLLDLAGVARDMGLQEGTIRSWLGHLRKRGYVRVERVAGHLRVTIHRWRPSVVRPAPAEPTTSPRHARPRLTAGHLASRLGADKDDPFFADIVATAPAGVLRETMEEVLAVPADRIRKSRAALFRYLIRQRLNR